MAVRADADGTGSASFAWQQVIDAMLGPLVGSIDATVGRPVRVLGLRFVDSDGREVTGPVPAGLVVIGFAPV
jgi:hypothetical protein